MATSPTALEEASDLQPLLGVEDIDATPVYPIIHMVRADVIHFIDTPLSYEALMAPDLTYTLIRPLQEKYSALQRSGNFSIVFCFLINCVHFRRDQNFSTRTLSRSRSTLCEILAVQILREHGENLLEIALALTTSWPVYNGAPADVLEQARQERDDDLEDTVGNAIEMAILSKSKRFIKSYPCQKIIDNIWSGRCVYQARSSHAILSDTYKRTPIHFYDPRKAPLLDHYRLKVPAVRSVLEYMNFLIMFIFFVVALEFSEQDHINPAETAFMVYALGFSLEKVAAMQEHGIRVYSTGTWNPFDLAIITIFYSYAFLRIYGVNYHSGWALSAGSDCLALAACLIFPRLAFVTLKNNLMVLSLRAMLLQFVALMMIAAFCFGGFLYALWTLSRSSAGYSAGQIAWWMLDLWFGLDASGFDRATKFHPAFGPLLMVTYACLSNTLLLTVLVSILSHTFSKISEDAAAEVRAWAIEQLHSHKGSVQAMFRRAVSTIEGVKADSLFSYQPPVNLIALFVMLPASYVLSPRWFHKVNVFMIRLTSFPILLFIAWYERQSLKSGTTNFAETVGAVAEAVFDTLPRTVRRLAIFEGLAGSGGDIDLVFEIEDERSTLPPSEETFAGEDTLPISSQKQDDKGQGTQETQAPHPTNGSPTPLPMQRQLEGRRPPPATSPPRGGASSSSPPHPPIRQRLNSVMTRSADAAQTFTSPLAQIFQPLIVADDDTVDDGADTPLPSPIVSYGPATRRRLSSMHRPTGLQHQLSSQDQQGHLRPISASPRSHSSNGGINQIPFSESLMEDGPETVEEVDNDKAQRGGETVIARRLERMEQRQRKIEELLLSISRELKIQK